MPWWRLLRCSRGPVCLIRISRRVLGLLGALGGLVCFFGDCDLPEGGPRQDAARVSGRGWRQASRSCVGFGVIDRTAGSRSAHRMRSHRPHRHRQAAPWVWQQTGVLGENVPEFSAALSWPHIGLLACVMRGGGGERFDFIHVFACFGFFYSDDFCVPVWPGCPTFMIVRSFLYFRLSDLRP